MGDHRNEFAWLASLRAPIPCREGPEPLAARKSRRRGEPLPYLEADAGLGPAGARRAGRSKPPYPARATGNSSQHVV